MRSLSFGVGLCLLVACNEPWPPPKASAASCAQLAQQLASLELGTAAKPEQRAPVVAKHRASCETANVTPAEMACFAKANDTWSAIACAPRMFEDTGTLQTECKQVISRMRIAVSGTMPADTGSAGAAMVDKMMAIMQTACVDDRWPASLRACVMATRPGDMPALQACNAQLPQDMQQNLSKRLAQGMAPPDASSPSAPAVAPPTQAKPPANQPQSPGQPAQAKPQP